MSGDYTRFTFDPKKGYSGVRHQQGRVSLDADFVEFEEILDRQRRARMFDTVGRAVVPRTTEDGFKIGLNAGKLTIGRGRAYVDGILVECFGDLSDASKSTHDTELGGVLGDQIAAYAAPSNPTPADLLATQPFWYANDYPGISETVGTRNLVYLDVWQREVTVFEDPDLREPALNGPDTTTRVQTAWQVKTLGVQASTCSASMPEWDQLIAPSTGRLSVGTTPVTPQPGPCVVSPEEGYTGIENRLYRVEVHKGGTIGPADPAQFKWSRDNASIQASVLGITADASGSWIRVDSLGADNWRRFSVGDHIELIDDHVEFARYDKDVGGTMAIIREVRAAASEIRVDTNLAAFAIVESRHPRIVRWDRIDDDEALTRDVLNGTAIDLEEGIQVTFSGTDDGILRAGDYWVFAARTAEGTVESFNNAPPRGILHHFAKLALVDGGTAGSIQDCRVHWPPEYEAGAGCCSAVVFPGDSIQQAIDRLANTGGCVCLKAGIHEIAEPIRINRSDITLRGEAPWVTVRKTTDGADMLIIQSEQQIRNVHVTGIRFEVSGTGSNASTVLIRALDGGSISTCGFFTDTRGERPSGTTTHAISLLMSRDISLSDNEAEGFPIGVLGVECTRIRVRDSSFLGPAVENDRLDIGSLGDMGIRFANKESAPIGIVIERNELTHYRRGIQVGDLEEGIRTNGDVTTNLDTGDAEPGCRIAGNVVRRRGSRREVEQQTGVWAGILSSVWRSEIVENAIMVTASVDAGIIASGGHALIARNEIRSTLQYDSNLLEVLPPYGIGVVDMANLQACTIQDNLLSGILRAIHGLRSTRARGSAHIDVISNRIIGSPELLEAIVAMMKTDNDEFDTKSIELLPNFSAVHVSGIESIHVARNDISVAVCGIMCSDAHIHVAANLVTGGGAAIAIVGTEINPAPAQVLDNTVREMMIAGILLMHADGSTVARNALGTSRFGIMSLMNRAARIADNRITGGNVGIELYLDIAPEIHGNTVEDASLIGIRTLLCSHRVTLSHNHVIRCGYRPNDEDWRVPATGVNASETFGTLVIDSCHVIDTGESGEAGSPHFQGVRLGVVVDEAGGTQLHGNVIMSRPLLDTESQELFEPHIESRALVIRSYSERRYDVTRDAGAVAVDGTFPFADAANNHIEQSVSTLAEIECGDREITGDISFADNRCLNIHPKMINDNDAAVDLRGTNLTVTGNRVHCPANSFAFRINAVNVSALGNVTTNQPDITAGSVAPSPYNDFNVFG